MKHIFTSLSATVIILLLSFTDSYAAAKILAGDLYYTHVSGNTYKVNLALYGTCGGAAISNTLTAFQPQICIYDDTTLITTLKLAIDTPDCGVEETALCPIYADSTQCTSPSYTYPGYKRYVFSDTVTLPHTSTTWRFIYTGYNGDTTASTSCGSGTAFASGRAAAITNLSGSGSTIMQLIDTLNNLTFANSSAVFTVAPQTYFCLDSVNDFNPLPVDPDSDALTITAVTPGNGSGTTSCVIGADASYISGGLAWPGTPLSGATPLQCSAGAFSVNSSTGELIFNPNLTQRSIIDYNIEERRAGILVGTSQHEMTVIVLTCGTPSPWCITMLPTAVSTAVTDKYSVEIFPNPAFDELTIKMNTGAYNSFTICNNIGQVLIQQPLTAAQTGVNVKTLPPGVYYITFKGTNGTTVQKFVK